MESRGWNKKVEDVIKPALQHQLALHYQLALQHQLAQQYQLTLQHKLAQQHQLTLQHQLDLQHQLALQHELTLQQLTVIFQVTSQTEWRRNMQLALQQLKSSSLLTRSLFTSQHSSTHASFCLYVWSILVQF